MLAISVAVHVACSLLTHCPVMWDDYSVAILLRNDRNVVYSTILVTHDGHVTALPYVCDV